MIDKQKLIKWVEGEIYVYSGPYDDATPEQVVKWKAKVQILRKLEMEISCSTLDVEEVAHERS